MPKESDRKWDSAFYWPPPPPGAGFFHSSVSIPEGPDFSPAQLDDFSFPKREIPSFCVFYLQLKALDLDRLVGSAGNLHLF